MSQASASHSLGHHFVILQSVDSTNKYAMELIQQNSLPERQTEVLHGMAVFALEQSAGRGQRGKAWLTEPGANIILSVIIRPESVTVRDQFVLSMAIALGVRSFFARYAGEEDCFIKWPNDLYWRDRKAGGILIESIIGNNAAGGGETGQWKWAVAGMGININQVVFPENIPNPVSLKQISGKTSDTVVLARELCASLDSWYERVVNKDWGFLLSAYNSCLYKNNQPVKLRKGTRVFEAIINGVSLQGRLRVQHAVEEEFDFGEVEWIIPV